MYQRVTLTSMSSVVQLYQMVKYVCTHEGQHQGPHTEETLGPLRLFVVPLGLSVFYKQQL